MNTLLKKVDHFFFNPSTALPLAILRILISLILITQAFMVAPDLFEFYGKSGLLQMNITDMFSENSFIPHLGIISPLLHKYFNIDEDQTLMFFFASYLLSLSFLLLGYLTRFSSFMCWAFHLVLLNSNQLTNYGVDRYLHYTLFYFIFAPMGEVLSLDKGFHFSSSSFSKTSMNTFALRIMQIHFSITYLAAGFGKVLGEQWRSGEAIWRALMLPDYAFYDYSFLAKYPYVCLFLCWWTVIIEMLYPIFAFNKKTQTFWILNIIAMHIGIVVFLKLTIFGLTMIAINVSLFLTPQIWSLLALRYRFRFFHPA